MPLRTLFLNPPSFENFDGGASSRWPATREIESYWYPVWLAYPAGMREGSRLLDAPPHHVSADTTIPSCCIHLSRCTPRAVVQHSAPSACGPRLSAVTPGASARLMPLRERWLKLRNTGQMSESFSLTTTPSTFKDRARSSSARSSSL